MEGEKNKFPWKRFHFVGIGGIGVSAIARLLKREQKIITGSDLCSSKIITALKKNGIKIFIGPHQSKNLLSGVEVVVYSVAVEANNPELLEAKKRGLKIFSYPEIVGRYTEGKELICVAGTHGKTTTTALCGLMLQEAKLDPTVIVGSVVPNFKSNARYGRGRYLVLEADEYRSAFLKYKPKIIILTAIDFDHPDCFKDLDSMLAIYRRFLEKLPLDGVVIACADQPNVVKILKGLKRNFFWYGLKEKKDSFTANKIRVDKNLKFEVKRNNITLAKNVTLRIHGTHNVRNSLAVFALAKLLNINFSVVKKSLKSYLGSWRRFEIKAQKKGIVFIDDYAHHPTEIAAVIESAKSRFPKRRVIAIFQPHHQDRTQALFNDFPKAFTKANLIVLTDVYLVPGRTNQQKVNMDQMKKLILNERKKVFFVKNFWEIPDFLKKILKKGDVVLILGAGNINLITPQLIRML